MIDIKLIREQEELVKENIKKKFQEHKLPLLKKIKILDEEWRKEKTKSDKLRAERNKISKEISTLIKEGKEKEAETKKEEAKKIPQKLEKIEEKRRTQEEQINKLLRQLPNIIEESVPIGKSDKENVVRETIGKPKKTDYEILNHAELAEQLGILNIESARTTSGQGFYYLKGDLARLHSALLSYARDFMIQKGYEYIIPPYMIRKEVVEGVMSFEEMDAMMYKIEGEDLYLIGTSEHSMIGMYKDTTLQKKDIPQKITSYSPCFRKEKGAHGIEEKGLYRVHQFEKQEMIIICEPEESKKYYEEMIDINKEYFKTLELPVRIIECCSGDLADLKAKSADFEAWSPRQQKYWEITSCSNMTSAQSRRLGIKINGGKGNYYAHTLNNTVIAPPRILIALIENNQEKNGDINIPKILRPYMGGTTKITKKR